MIIIAVNIDNPYQNLKHNLIPKTPEYHKPQICVLFDGLLKW